MILEVSSGSLSVAINAKLLSLEPKNTLCRSSISLGVINVGSKISKAIIALGGVFLLDEGRFPMAVFISLVSVGFRLWKQYGVYFGV